MFYTFCIIMIIIASILLILAVLVQSPKSGMAANFGAANQTMGVRQTTDFLEKFTWAMVAAVVFFTLLSVVALPSQETAEAEDYSKYEQTPEQTEVEAEDVTVNLADPNAEDAVVVEETTTDTEEPVEPQPAE